MTEKKLRLVRGNQVYINVKRIKEFLEQFDLGWNEDCYTIAKVTFEREIMKEGIVRK